MVLAEAVGMARGSAQPVQLPVAGQLIDRYQAEEREVSFRRRMLHGYIDLLRTALVARLRESGGKSVLDQVDVDHLAAILAGKAAPPSEE